ncbi:14 kDa zinc-binding protein [Orobanche minor]
MAAMTLLRGPLSVRAFIKASSNHTPPRIALLPFVRRCPLLPFRRVLSSLSGGATSDEEAAVVNNAYSGAPTMFGPLSFDKIISKEIPSTIVYEDEAVLAFRDINPQAPVHVLVIPKSRDGLTELGKAENTHQEILGRLLYAAKIVAEKEGIADGFRVVINSGTSACQAVFHLHLHVLGGRQMEWPPG